MNIDRAHELTDQELEKMERHLSAIYSRAGQELGKTWKAYLAEVGEELKSLQEEYDLARKSGDRNAIRKSGRSLAGAKQEATLMNDHYRRLSSNLADDIRHVDEIAVAYVNDKLPEVYARNYNMIADGLKKQAPGYSFELTSAEAVKNLASSDKTLLPYKKVNGRKVVRWNTQKINGEVLQGILQGESMDKIASRLSNVIGMEEDSAIRNARTSVTSAENKGRYDMLREAAAKGLEVKKVWLAASDGRTRDEHAELDGMEADIEEPFVNGFGEIMYPGDPGAEPANVYNCRCTLIYRVVGLSGARR